jgi:hypothetical protein
MGRFAHRNDSNWIFDELNRGFRSTLDAPNELQRAFVEVVRIIA